MPPRAEWLCAPRWPSSRGLCDRAGVIACALACSLCSTTAFYGAVERRPLSAPTTRRARRCGRVYSKACVVCAAGDGTAIAFPDNDRPGILLAGRRGAYSIRWAPRRRGGSPSSPTTTTWTATAADLAARGLDVARADPTPVRAPRLPVAETFQGRAGDRHPRGALRLTGADGSARRRRAPADACRGAWLVSGPGWNPNLHLSAQQRTRPSGTRPRRLHPRRRRGAGPAPGGAAVGPVLDFGALADGAAAARAALARPGGLTLPGPRCRGRGRPRPGSPPSGTWPARRAAPWLDFPKRRHREDIALARAGGISLLVRSTSSAYTTLGWGDRPGRTANTSAFGVMPRSRWPKSSARPCTDDVRPPYNPVSIGAFAGRFRAGAEFRPNAPHPTTRGREHGA